MERPERSGVRYRDYERPKETSAEVAKRSGKNMNDIDTETPRGMQGQPWFYMMLFLYAFKTFKDIGKSENIVRLWSQFWGLAHSY